MDITNSQERKILVALINAEKEGLTNLQIRNEAKVDIEHINSYLVFNSGAEDVKFLKFLDFGHGRYYFPTENGKLRFNELLEDLSDKEFSKLVSETTLEASKAAKDANTETKRHLPKVRRLMILTIIIAAISGTATIISLYNAISNQKAQKSTQEMLMKALEQSRLKDSSIQSLAKENSYLFHLILKDSSKKTPSTPIFRSDSSR